MIAIRPVDLADAAVLSKLYVDNWSFLARWEPVRDEAFFTEDGQRARLTQARQAIDDGIGYGCVIEVDGPGTARPATVSQALAPITSGPRGSRSAGCGSGTAISRIAAT